MKKVFLIHGFEGTPNGGWRPWLMGELAAADVYACALAMPNPAEPMVDAWVEEIERHAQRNAHDELYLVGHSLGVPAILRYVELAPAEVRLAGAVLVAGPAEHLGDNALLNAFLDAPFDFPKIQSKIGKVAVIHGDDDPLVPFHHAELLARNLSAELIVVPHGRHLNGSSGWTALPQAKEALLKMGV